MLFNKSGSVEWMVVFLGNPGPKYNGTRHNAGFQVADVMEKKCNTSINRLKCKALTAKTTLGGKSVLLVKPQTFMNLSGEAVQPLSKFYKIPPERIIVVSDEMSLNPGSMRLRAAGSAGGHNGLKNIIQMLGTDQFPRLRIGVGKPPRADYDQVAWVLGVIQNEDAEAVAKACNQAADAIECCIKDGLERAQNKYNN